MRTDTTKTERLRTKIECLNFNHSTEFIISSDFFTDNLTDKWKTNDNIFRREAEREKNKIEIHAQPYTQVYKKGARHKSNVEGGRGVWAAKAQGGPESAHYDDVVRPVYTQRKERNSADGAEERAQSQREHRGR